MDITYIGNMKMNKAQIERLVDVAVCVSEIQFAVIKRRGKYCITNVGSTSVTVPFPRRYNTRGAALRLLPLALEEARMLYRARRVARITKVPRNMSIPKLSGLWADY